MKISNLLQQKYGINNDENENFNLNLLLEFNSLRDLYLRYKLYNDCLEEKNHFEPRFSKNYMNDICNICKSIRFENIKEIFNYENIDFWIDDLIILLRFERNKQKNNKLNDFKNEKEVYTYFETLFLKFIYEKLKYKTDISYKKPFEIPNYFINEYFILFKDYNFLELEYLTNNKNFDYIRFLDCFDFNNSKFQIRWNVKLLKYHFNSINWDYFCLNDQSITIEIINTYILFINFNLLSENQNMNWNFDIIDKYSDSLNWNELIKNNKISWNNELIIKYEKFINFKTLSSSNLLNLNLLNRYKEKWDLRLLIENTNLNWTLEIYNIFKEKIYNNKGEFYLPFSISDDENENKYLSHIKYQDIKISYRIYLSQCYLIDIFILFAKLSNELIIELYDELNKSIDIDYKINRFNDTETYQTKKWFLINYNPNIYWYEIILNLYFDYLDFSIIDSKKMYVNYEFINKNFNTFFTKYETDKNKKIINKIDRLPILGYLENINIIDISYKVFIENEKKWWGKFNKFEYLNESIKCSIFKEFIIVDNKKIDFKFEGIGNNLDEILYNGRLQFANNEFYLALLNYNKYLDEIDCFILNKLGFNIRESNNVFEKDNLVPVSNSNNLELLAEEYFNLLSIIYKIKNFESNINISTLIQKIKNIELEIDYFGFFDLKKFTTNELSISNPIKICELIKNISIINYLHKVYDNSNFNIYSIREINEYNNYNIDYYIDEIIKNEYIFVDFKILLLKNIRNSKTYINFLEINLIRNYIKNYWNEFIKSYNIKPQQLLSNQFVNDFNYEEEYFYAMTDGQYGDFCDFNGYIDDIPNLTGY